MKDKSTNCLFTHSTQSVIRILRLMSTVLYIQSLCHQYIKSIFPVVDDSITYEFLSDFCSIWLNKISHKFFLYYCWCLSFTSIMSPHVLSQQFFLSFSIESQMKNLSAWCSESALKFIRNTLNFRRFYQGFDSRSLLWIVKVLLTLPSLSLLLFAHFCENRFCTLLEKNWCINFLSAWEQCLANFIYLQT